MPDILNLENKDIPSFVSLIGLTYCNYDSKTILKILTDISKWNGYILFDTQLIERINIDKIKDIYLKDTKDVCLEKVKLLNLNPKTDIDDLYEEGSVEIKCKVSNVNKYLKDAGMENGDSISLFKSIRKTKDDLQKDMNSLNYKLFDTGDSIVSVLILPRIK